MTSGHEPVPLSRRRLWLVQLAVCFSALTSTIDSGSMVVGLYVLAQTFEVSTATASWLVLLNFLVVSSTLLLFGRLSDLLGSKVVFTAGFAVYALGSLLCSLAAAFPFLLVFRGVQTLGISMLSANSSAILTENFPPSQRGTALGVNSTMVGAGAFIGPLVAGLVLSTLGWRYVFLLSVPIALAGFAAAVAILPRGTPSASRRIDLPGIVLFASATTSLLFALNQGRTLGWGSTTVLGLAGVAVLATGLFVMVERATPEPMVDLSLFSNRLFSFSLLAAASIFFGLSGEDVMVPLFVQQVMLFGPATAGAMLSIVYICRMALASPSGWLSDRFGTRPLAVIGSALIAAGFVGLSRMDGSTGQAQMIGLLMAVGIGSGIFFSANMSAIMGSVPRSRLGLASSAIGLRRNLGNAIGVATAATLLQASDGGGREALVSGFQVAFLVGTVGVALGAIFALLGGSTAVLRAVPAPAREAALPGQREQG